MRIRPAPSPSEVSRSTRTPLPDPPLWLLLKCILCLVFVILFQLFIAWQCSLVASGALCAWGCPSLVEELWCTDCRLCPRLQEV